MQLETLVQLAKRGMGLLHTWHSHPEGPPLSVEEAADMLDRGFAKVAGQFIGEGIPSYETALALHAAVSVLSRPTIQWMAEQVGTSFEQYNEYCLSGSIEQVATYYGRSQNEVSTLLRELIRLLDQA